MCPFCIGAAAWAVTGAASAGGLGALAAFVHRQRTNAPSDARTAPNDSLPPAERPSQP